MTSEVGQRFCLRRTRAHHLLKKKKVLPAILSLFNLCTMHLQFIHVCALYSCADYVQSPQSLYTAAAICVHQHGMGTVSRDCCKFEEEEEATGNFEPRLQSPVSLPSFWLSDLTACDSLHLSNTQTHSQIFTTQKHTNNQYRTQKYTKIQYQIQKMQTINVKQENIQTINIKIANRSSSVWLPSFCLVASDQDAQRCKRGRRKQTSNQSIM